jgi:hypothetical protein
LLKSVSRLSEFGSIRIGLGFGHVSVSHARSLCLEISFVFSLSAIGDLLLTETKPLRRIFG